MTTDFLKHTLNKDSILTAKHTLNEDFDFLHDFSSNFDLSIGQFLRSKPNQY